MNKKLTASAVIIVIVAASIAAWLVHTQISELQIQNGDLQEQVNELQDQNRDLQDKNDELQEQLDLLQKRVDFSPEVLITKFSSKDGWWNPVGVTLALDPNITIENTGISDIDGLTLEIKRRNLDEDPYNITKRLDILHAGESTEIYDSIFTGIQFFTAEFRNRSFVAILKLGDVVLDEEYLLPYQYP
jgi:FtsZ-binding cell division protein ZapB